MHEHYAKAFRALSILYKKIIEVDLTSNTYEMVDFGVKHTYFDTMPKTGVYTTAIQVLVDNMVVEDDRDMVRYFLGLEHLRKHFSGENRTFYFRYRQMVDGRERWQVAEMARDENYSSEKQLIYFYIKDIHDTYSAELKLYEDMENLCKIDTLTGLQNFYSYKRVCISYQSYHRKHDLGVIFCDLNGLKLINDTKGHSAGNDFINDFTKVVVECLSQEEIYRISGDEFLILFYDKPKEEIDRLTEILKEKVMQNGSPMAAIGSAWYHLPETIEQVVDMAEVGMYADKANFYNKHPELKRDVFEANFGREMLAIISTLTELYPTVGVIDLATDTYRMLKADNSSQTAAEGKSYSEYIDILMNKIVTPETYDEADKLAGINKLREALKDKDKASIVYESRKGGWRHLTCQRLEMKNGIVSKVIFYINYVDKKY